MTPFAYARAANSREAVALLAEDPDARCIAGGTNLVDLMKEGVARPSRLVDISRLTELQGVTELSGGGLRIGALVNNAALADDPRLRQGWPPVAQALLAGASPQLRNAATTAGNLLQRTRCFYFTDATTPCNKRMPGDGCAAREGHHHIHAIFGWSDACIATHPSDMAAALLAHDAIVHTQTVRGADMLPLAELHRLPGDDPSQDTVLPTGVLITAVELPPSRFGARAHFAQGARAQLLRLRDGVGRRGAAARRPASAARRSGSLSRR